MWLVVTGVVPDAYETFLKNFFGQVTTPHETQRNTMQAWGYAVVQSLKSAAISQ